MSLVSLPEDFLYERLPQALLSLDERGLIQSVVGGYQDRLEDLRAYSKDFQLFFSSVGLPQTGYNVVFVDLTTTQGVVITRSLDIDATTPTDPTQLLAWATGILNVDPESGALVANARFGLDLLRYVDADILSYLASNIGAVLYASAAAQAQPDIITNSGTFTAVQASHQKLVETYFPRLKFKGTTRSFEAMGKLMGFDDVRMVPLWSRLSPRLPNDPGAAQNDADYSEVPDFYPQQVLNPFYNPLNQRDGPFFAWSGTVSNGTAATNYWTEVVNDYNPWVTFAEADASIQGGTLPMPTTGTYALADGAPHFHASVAVGTTGTFTSLGEGDCWNGLSVAVTNLGGSLCRLDILDQLSSVKYRSSFYDLGITMDADKADELFGTQTPRANADIAAAGHAYVSYSGVLTGTSPYRPFTSGTAFFNSTTGIDTSDFLTPFGGTVAFYQERREATIADAQQNFTALAQAGQNVVQALEEVRAATRQPRRAAFGYLQDEQIAYAPIPQSATLTVVPPSSGTEALGTIIGAPLPPYTTGITVYSADGTFVSEDTTNDQWPARVFHTVQAGSLSVTGFTIPETGSYSVSVTNTGASAATILVDFFGTVGPTDYPDTHEVIRPEPLQPKLYLDRPEDQMSDDQLFETLDEYPYRRDILGGGELIETDFSVVPGTAYAEYSILDQTMAVKDQTQVDYDVFVAFGDYPVPQFVVQPKGTPYTPGQRAIAFNAQFRDQASLTVNDTDPFANPGGRSFYFHAELDNVFQPGYQLYHAGLVNGVLVADADKFSGSHHLAGLQGWLPFNEHPESSLVVNDVVRTLAVQAVTGVVPQDRTWDDEQGFSLVVQPGAVVASSCVRDCDDDLTISFWVNTDNSGGLAQVDSLDVVDDIVEFGNVKFSIDWTDSPPLLSASALREDTGAWQVIGTVPLTGWQFVYLRKGALQAYFGQGSLQAVNIESYFDASSLSTTFAPNSDIDLLTVSAYSASWQVRDLRIWNQTKTPADMALVKYHAPTPTVVPYRIGHVLALNTGDRYGLQVLPNGWLAATAMPAWFRTPAYATVVRYNGDGEFEGEPYRKEVGLGGGTNLPPRWQLGEQFYSLTADGTVAVSTQTGALPGSSPLWRGDATGVPGDYITLSGPPTGQGVTATVTVSGSGSSPWPNLMEATNSAVESIWLPDDDGHVYQVQLEAQGAGVVFIATPGTASNQEQGDATAFLARPGYYLGVTGDGNVIQKPYSGTVTTPPLYLYLNDTLLEDVSGPDTLARWTDPTVFSLDYGYPVLQTAGAVLFGNTSTLLPGTYKLTLDLGNDGKVDTQFNGYRIDVTVGDTTFSNTFLQGYTGSNFRGQQELMFTLDHIVPSGWLLTLEWLNPFSDPLRGLVRQLVIYGYELRRLETNLYGVTLAPSGSAPVLTRLSLQPTSEWGAVPGGWLAQVNSYGTVSVVTHEGTFYPANDTLRSRYPLANILTGVTERKREDILVAGTYCLPDGTVTPVVLGSTPTPPDSSIIAGQLSGLVWNMAIDDNASGCVNPADQSVVMAGQAGYTYNVTLKFRGVVERKWYLNGPVTGSVVPGTDSDWLYTGSSYVQESSPQGDYGFLVTSALDGSGQIYPASGANEYVLKISNPPQVYALNNANSWYNASRYLPDFQMTVPILAGATVTLTARSIDGDEYPNGTSPGSYPVGALSMPDVTPLLNAIVLPQPFNGQWMQMDVISIT